jgi:lysophospholipase L1-like esterase
MMRLWVRVMTAVTAALLLTSCSHPARTPSAPPVVAPATASTLPDTVVPQPGSAAVPRPGAAVPPLGSAAGRRIRIMPLGDSITAGAGSAHEDGYRADLYRMLTGAGWDVDFVGSQHSGGGPDDDHEGHSGWTMTQLARRLHRWLIAYRPDVVVLHAGTNDLRTPQAALFAPQVLTRVLAQIARDRPFAQVLVAQIVGNRNIGDGAVRQERADAYNARVVTVVASAGARFHLVDQSAVRGRDLADKLHPNDAGYRTMALNWFEALQQL